MTLDTRKNFSEKVELSRPSEIPTGLKGKDLLIAVEGVIGVGKSSLVRLLKDHWKVSSQFETFEQNPFLTQGFYTNKQKHAFDTEVFFLLSRLRQHRALLHSTGVQLIDYFFDKSWIFAQMNLSPEDLEIYRNLYESFKPQTRKPDLVVLLQADLETLVRRIYFRDREFERSLHANYLEVLSNQYYEYFSQYAEAPVLRISTTGTDFVNNPEDLKRICNLIDERLRGTVQLRLGRSTEQVEQHA